MTKSVKNIAVKRRQELNAKSAIIDILSIRGESTKWDLAKETKMHYSTCFKAVKSLEKRSLIKVARSDKISEKGQKIKTYDLTIEGLINFLYRMRTRLFFEPRTDHKRIGQVVNKIAKLRASMLPLVLGKWDLFERTSIKDLAIETLLLTASQHWLAIREQEITIKRLKERKIPEKYIQNYLLWPHWFLDRKIIIGRPDLTESFTEFFYRIRLIIPDSDAQAKWLQTIASDDETRLYVLGILKKAEKIFRNEAEANAAMIGLLQDTERKSLKENDKASLTMES